MANKQEVFSITFAPGAVSADSTVDLPAGCPEIGSIIEGALIASTIDTQVFAETALAPVIDAADIASNKISAVDGNTVRLGTAATTLMLLRVTYRVK